MREFSGVRISLIAAKMLGRIVGRIALRTTDKAKSSRGLLHKKTEVKNARKGSSTTNLDTQIHESIAKSLTRGAFRAKEWHVWGKVGSSWRVPVQCGPDETPQSLAFKAVHALTEKNLGMESRELQTTESHLINYNPNSLVDCEGKVVETEVRLVEATPEETGARGAQLVFEVETLDARGNLSALNRFDFSVADFVCDEGASLSYTVRPRMSPGIGEMEGWDPNFSPQAEAWERADSGRTHLDILLAALRIQLGDLRSMKVAFTQPNWRIYGGEVKVTGWRRGRERMFFLMSKVNNGGGGSEHLNMGYIEMRRSIGKSNVFEPQHL